ncbi:hypothetical protein BO70DRAFT_135194 [Aspergillus heteromorphus CBS 117.55]|uniref:Uncharacterized protein n=1 Tax=Aspergillus heteromorphus CBS 117.55 TaxID=1448321 RepID=A0A317WXT6_9EURO|nr:uncharacterized protein BO70DRAFT_135194 [Aspergillus heteromorphus CBS 117.55]PWY90152.1 hypothetical protein BO70DRAFT_135194 [Aspergillus heteromorphus CBS 117.55]
MVPGDFVFVIISFGLFFTLSALGVEFVAHFFWLSFCCFLFPCSVFPSIIHHSSHHPMVSVLSTDSHPIPSHPILFSSLLSSRAVSPLRCTVHSCHIVSSLFSPLPFFTPWFFHR